MQAARKSDAIVNTLLRQIVSGALPPGSVLPTEVELAALHGVNRSVVREANKLLEVHGLVQPIRRRGTVVLDPRLSLSPLVLRGLLVDGEGRIDGAVLEDFLEIRAELDVMMCGLAARRRTAEQVATLDAALERLAGLTDDPLAYGRAVGELAAALADAAGNRLFPTLVHWHRAVYDDLEAVFSEVRTATGPHLQGCQMLVAAIKAGEPELARRLVRGFHDWARDHLRRVLEETP